ncbi:DUF3027 domain-containing protein [Microbacterium sp. G2-8]|uniref:DUF3027 domain-containing protein n=1 Tax=Microbacterium sp. G2-8 TaxID=2842454 RepID=UPI001C8A6076|nr:DUF3027 domain-containing protein [Microbacterium sp. G2-8]
MTSTSELDSRLVEAHDLARSALFEITPEATVGEPAGYRAHDDGVVSLRFANEMPGYPGWFWTVSVAAVEGEDPTVLEAELLPGDEALVAPEWIPWSQRLEEYKAAQAAAAAESDDDSEDDDEDDDELHDDGSSILHAGDVDGVDIDELDDSGDESEDEDDEDDDEDDEDDDHDTVSDGDGTD